MKKQRDSFDYLQFDYDYELPVFNRSYIVAGEFDLTEEHFIKTPKTVPHCDCQGANEAVGIFFDKHSGSSRLGAMQQIVPTEDDKCRHCEHAAYYRTIERQNKNYRGVYNERSIAKRPPKPALVALNDEKKKLSKPNNPPINNTDVQLVPGKDVIK